MAEQQMELPTSQEPAAPSAAQEPEAKKPRKKASKKASKKNGKKTGKKTGKKAAKKDAKSAPKMSKKAAEEAATAKRRRAAKKAAKKRAAKKEAAKEATKTAEAAKTSQPCGLLVHVRPSTAADLQQLAAWDDLDRADRRRALIVAGAVGALSIGAYLLFRSGKAKAALSGAEEAEDGSPDDGSPDDEEDVDDTEVLEDESDVVEDAEIDVNIEVGKTALPPPIKMGNIPAVFTRMYQIFDRFVEGGAEFFANVGDSESGHNIYANNPAGVVLSRDSVVRQMKSKTYGQKWNGKGKVPYTAYLEPEEAKKLGAIGLCQGIAGTIGQAGRRNGTALLAPIKTIEWMDPWRQLAAFMELFGALYHEFGATTPVAMRIAWGFPSKANKVDDPYYIDRSAKWAKRQQTTGVSAPSFSAMSLRDHSVEEVAAYFRQFDYGPIIEASASKPRMSPMVAPPSAAALTRFQQQLEEHPGIIGNDLT